MPVGKETIKHKKCKCRSLLYPLSLLTRLDWPILSDYSLLAFSRDLALLLPYTRKPYLEEVSREA